mmetsp:Transcript_26874/g.67668  ORF Transcript_26874/g.67668 Transcript_26874/m.67668 type:complete len:270 (+) Transcript_26874:942-1751(+)
MGFLLPHCCVGSAFSAGTRTGWGLRAACCTRLCTCGRFGKIRGICQRVRAAAGSSSGYPLRRSRRQKSARHALLVRLRHYVQQEDLRHPAALRFSSSRRVAGGHPLRRLRDTAPVFRGHGRLHSAAHPARRDLGPGRALHRPRSAAPRPRPPHQRTRCAPSNGGSRPGDGLRGAAHPCHSHAPCPYVHVLHDFAALPLTPSAHKDAGRPLVVRASPPASAHEFRNPLLPEVGGRCCSCCRSDVHGHVLRLRVEGDLHLRAAYLSRRARR